MTPELLRKIADLQAVTGGSSNSGWMCDPVCDFLHALVCFYRPEVVIQTGHLWGKSALVILDALEAVAVPPVPAKTGDEKFDEFVWAHLPLRIMGLSKLISIDPVENLRSNEWIEARYHNFHFCSKLSGLAEADWRGQRLMGVVDGDHTAEGCRSDLDALARMGAGLIFLDDTCWIPHLDTIGLFFASASGYYYSAFPWYNGVAVLTKKETTCRYI